MPRNAFDDMPYHKVKIELHNQNTKHHTEYEAPSRKKTARPGPMASMGKEDKIGPQVPRSYLCTLWSPP
jgi:hypothetical protein